MGDRSGFTSYYSHVKQLFHVMKIIVIPTWALPTGAPNTKADGLS